MINIKKIGSPNRINPFVILLGGCVLLVLSGCNKALAPTFRAVGVQEIAQENNRSVIRFTIEATNPNKEPIPLRQIFYTVEINGNEVFSGVRAAQLTLHTYSSHTFVLPAVLPLETLTGSGEVSYSLVGYARYIPPGRLSEVLFDSEMKVPEAPINLSGTINLGHSSGD